MTIDYNPMKTPVHFPPLDYHKQQAQATQKEYDDALRDALRYRFLRNEQSYREGAVFALKALGHRIEDFDAFIDEAMKGQNESSMNDSGGKNAD